MTLDKQQVSYSPEELFGRVYDTWGTGPGLYGLPYTPESFAELPKPEKISLLETIASFNPGYWAEEVLGRPVEITKVLPRVDIDGRPQDAIAVMLANIPVARVKSSKGEIKI